MSINNSTQAAFHTNTQANDQAVFVWDGQSVTNFADGSGTFSYVGLPDINDFGQVVFDASLDPSPSRGIFTGPDPVRDAVILPGQTIDGMRIIDLISYPQINNRGQIAFVARFLDNTEAVFLATPIPEPSGLALTIAAFFASFICAITPSRIRTHSTRNSTKRPRN